MASGQGRHGAVPNRTATTVKPELVVTPIDDCSLRRVSFISTGEVFCAPADDFASDPLHDNARLVRTDCRYILLKS